MACLVNIIPSLDKEREKRMERENAAGWVRRKVKTGRPAEARSFESVSMEDMK